MVVSEQRFAAQIVAMGAEPMFFDDLGCLKNYIRQRAGTATGAFVYVADHRTGSWVPGAAAIYTRPTALETPMGGGMIAHADTASRNADPAARGGLSVDARDVIGARVDGH